MYPQNIFMCSIRNDALRRHFAVSRTLIGKKFLVAVTGFTGAVYHNVITGFRVRYVSMVYVVAMAALALDLYHGGWKPKLFTACVMPESQCSERRS